MHVLQPHWHMVPIGVGAHGDGAPIATGFQLEWARVVMGTPLARGSNWTGRVRQWGLNCYGVPIELGTRYQRAMNIAFSIITTKGNVVWLMEENILKCMKRS